MYRLRKSIDPGLLLTLALTCFLALPLASKAGLPDGRDLQIQAFSASELQRGWEQGLFFFKTLDALRCFLLLCFALCSGGMYLFCKRRGGRLGAIIAGLVYVYSPYLMYDTAFARGAYGELLALAIFPLLLWRVDALRDRPTPVSFLLVCLMQAVLLFTQLRTALVLTGIAFAWLAFETLIQRINREASQVESASGLLALMALGLGIAAASTFWLPALLESDSIHLRNPRAPAALEYPENFLRMGELLAAPPLLAAGMSKGLRPIYQLGIAQWGLALLGGASGLLLYIRGYRTRHPQTLLSAVFFGLLAVALIGLVVPESREVWDRIEPLRSLQFPGRFLGPIAACLAIVASLNGLWLSRLQAPYQVSTIAMLSALPLVTAIPLLYVSDWRLTALDTSLAAYHQPHQPSELNPALSGAAATGAYLPRATQSAPTATEALLSDFADGRPVDRLNRKPLPPARDLAAAVSALAVVLAFLAAWRLRGLRLTPRPYWTAAPLKRAQIYGVLLAGLIMILCLLLSFGAGGGAFAFASH